MGHSGTPVSVPPGRLPRQKEIYVLNEKPLKSEYINLGDLIEKNGGLLRIPFLCKSQGLIYIIKFWGSQILNIMRSIHKLGLIINVLRLKDFYISKDGMKIKLSNVKGIGEVNHFGIVSELPPDQF